jgi:ArsR family transcriptional regulator, arsenate/arsenite/antimonite-responsive transcriptional repressor
VKATSALGLPVVSDGCVHLSVTAEPLDRPAAERSAKLLKAVADPARLQLLSIILAAEEGEVCVCDLIEPLGLSQPTVSHHLKVLVDAGLLARERRGTWAYFSVVPERWQVLRDLFA